MAFSAALRRAASAATPLAARALRLSHHSPSLVRPLSLRAASFLGERAAGPSFPAVARFSSKTAPAPSSSDDDLLSVIDDEIKCALESDDHDRVEQIPEGFPFEMEDEKGMNVITLRRKYDGETIEIIVSMPSLVTGEEPEDDKGNDDNEDEDGDQEERPSQSSIPLTVSVSKGEDTPSLEFSCTAYPDEVVIDSMSVRENKDSDEMLAYEGPDFTDLDENLQKAFHKYLEIRGISPMTTNFLHEYMINKDSREYLLWLKNLKQFIQK